MIPITLKEIISINPQIYTFHLIKCTNSAPYYVDLGTITLNNNHQSPLLCPLANQEVISIYFDLGSKETIAVVYLKANKKKRKK